MVLKSSAISLPLSPSNLGLFISFMFDKIYACSTARPMCLRWAIVADLLGIVIQPKYFALGSRNVKRLTKMGMREDIRLPITLPILSSIVDNIPTLCFALYESRLYQAMCTTAFFAFSQV